MGEHGESEGERRTREINPARTYDDCKGTPDGKQCDSERSKSFHDEKTVMVFIEKVWQYRLRGIELKNLRHGSILYAAWVVVRDSYNETRG